MRAGGATDVVLEATSHALDQGRVAGCAFRVAAMTNLTQDHLDYHGDMERYADAKAILFEQPDRQGARRRGDVRRRRGGADDARARHGGVGAPGRGAGAGGERGRGRREQRAGRGRHARHLRDAGRAAARSKRRWSATTTWRTSRIAVGMAIARGLPRRRDRARRRRCRGPGSAGAGRQRSRRVVRGRLRAHARRARARDRGDAAVARGRLIVVFGCGGDRDRGKRPVMGEIAARDADLAIVTSDNPRTEDPAAIVDMVLDGVRRTNAPKLAVAELGRATRGYHAEVDRRAAIRLAAAAARARRRAADRGQGPRGLPDPRHDQTSLRRSRRGGGGAGGGS